MRKKSLTKTLWKRAFRAAERSMIAFVNRRDKHCQLCKSTFILQSDHAIVSRRHLATFFEVKAQVLLCSKCHLKKTFNQHGLPVAVAAIVAEREGMTYVDWVIAESRKIKKYTLQELEDLTKEFNSQ